MTASSLPRWRGLDFEDGIVDIALIGPVLCSAFALLLSSSVDAAADPLVLWVAHGAQAAMLAISAASATAGGSTRLTQWVQRVAPSRAGQRACVRMWRQLRLTGALGLAGPLVLVAVWQSAHPGDVAGLFAGLLACLGLLGAAQLLGAWCGMAWRGRAPRWVMLGWLLLGLALANVRVVWGVLSAWPPAAALTLAAVAWGWWRLALQMRMSRVRLSWHGVPRWQPVSGPARLRVPSGWQRLRFSDLPVDDRRRWLLRRGVGLTKGGEMIMVLLCVMAPQLIGQPQLSLLSGWGHAVQGRGVLGYGGWMAMLAMYAGLAQLQPGLHWRRRLAPGWRPTGWAWRMLAASVAAFVGWLSLWVLLCWAGASAGARDAQLTTWPSVIGDAVFVSTFVAWMRGLCNRHVWAVFCALALGSVVIAVASLLDAKGLPLVRGGAWLALELGLSVPMAWAAVRAWSRQDMNAMVGNP